MTKTASEFIAQSLVDAGVRHVFGGHGGALVPLVNAVVDHPDLTWVCTRNEANASLMAAANSKLIGGSRLAACIATSGPGASNLVTGLLDAQLDRVPVIAITGTKPRADAAHSEFQDIDQSRLFAAGGLSYSVTVSDPLQLVAVMRDAVAIALTQRVCVHVAVPVDIQGMVIEAPTFLCSANPAEIARRIKGRLPDAAALEEIVRVLSSPDERIVIAVGLDARHEADLDKAAASSAILGLAEAIGAPVVTRLDAKGVVDETHPLAMGVIGVHGKPGLAAAAAVIEAATLVLALGLSDLSVLLCDPNGYQVRRMIEVAHDAHGVSTRFRAEHSVIASPIQLCRHLVERIASSQGEDAAASAVATARAAPATVPRQPSQLADEGLHMWHTALKSGKWKETDREGGGERALKRPREASSESVHPGSLMSALSPLMRSQDVVCVDTGDITLWASLCLRLGRGTTTLSSERLGTMGYALCAGVAASLERGPSAKAVVIAGDGGFQMTMNELGTAVQHKANLLVVVIDNGVLGRVEFGFKDAKGCSLTGCDWVALARAYGADGVHVTSDAEIGEALARGMASEGVFVVAARIDHEIKAEMAKPSDAKLPYWLSAPQHKVDSG